MHGVVVVGRKGRVIPKAIVQAIEANREDDSLHSGTALTATSAIGCPRALLISRMFPYEVKVEDLWTMDCGRRMHQSILEDIGHDEEWVTEVWRPELCMFKGKILGLGREMACKTDMFTQGVLSGEGPKEICDIKFTLSKADDWATEVAKPDHQVQLNLNKRLIEVSLGRSLKDCVLSILTVGKTWVRSISPHLTDEQLLAVSCGMTRYSQKSWAYGRLLKYVTVAFDKWDEVGVEKASVGAKEAIVREMPKVGLDMYVSKKGENKCTWCSVKRKCDEIGVGI